MIHQYKMNGYNIVVDVYSGGVHAVDELAYDIIALFENHSADEIVADLTPLAQRRSVTLFQECEDVSIKGSDTLIYRLLFNLVENGIKYNTPGGSVHITIQQKKSSAVLRVADTGCGIPEEYRTSVFQPFFRVDKSRSREMGGVGLGLALVREIALLHGGTVTAEPADGQGTVFTVTLPIQA